MEKKTKGFILRFYLLCIVLTFLTFVKSPIPYLKRLVLFCAVHEPASIDYGRSVSLMDAPDSWIRLVELFWLASPPLVGPQYWCPLVLLASALVSRCYCCGSNILLLAHSSVPWQNPAWATVMSPVSRSYSIFPFVLVAFDLHLWSLRPYYEYFHQWSMPERRTQLRLRLMFRQKSIGLLLRELAYDWAFSPVDDRKSHWYR